MNEARTSQGDGKHRSMMEALGEWLALEEDRRRGDPQRYFQGVAQARYVTRRITRIVDEQARREELEPLQHQALIQVFGAPGGLIQVNDLAERLDIAPAFSSRLVKELEEKGLVERLQSDEDRRVKLVRATEQAVAALRRIDEHVHMHVEYFQKQLSEEERVAALGIYAFYVGMELTAQERKRFSKGR